MNNKRVLAGVAGFWLLHLLASVAAFLWHYSLSYSRFDGHQVSGWALRLAGALYEILWWPLARGLYAWDLLPAWVNWLPLVANSGLWTLGVWLLWRCFRRLR